MGKGRNVKNWLTRGVLLFTVLVFSSGCATTLTDLYYLSLGDSLAAGVQPNLTTGENMETDEGYADQIFAQIQGTFPNLQLMKLGCPGETTATFRDGGLCTYEHGSQLDEAIHFIESKRDNIVLVTFDLGVNDLLGCVDGIDIDLECVEGALAAAGSNLAGILSDLFAALDGRAFFIGMNYYNPFLVFWLNPGGALGMELAMLSAGLQQALNKDVLAPVYGAFGYPIADVESKFMSLDFMTMVPLPPVGDVPINVALICQWTWMCAPAPVGPNIHGNLEGYGVIAEAFLDIFGPK